MHDIAHIGAEMDKIQGKIAGYRENIRILKATYGMHELNALFNKAALDVDGQLENIEIQHKYNELIVKGEDAIDYLWTLCDDPVLN